MKIYEALRCSNQPGMDFKRCAECEWVNIEWCDDHAKIAIAPDVSINGRGAWINCDYERIMEDAAKALEVIENGHD